MGGGVKWPGVAREIRIPFANQQKFKNFLNRRTISLGYYGSDGDLELLKGFISELAWQKKAGVKALGIHEHDKRMVFVGSGSAVAAGNTPVNDILQLERYRSIDSAILGCAQVSPEELQTIGELLMNYNEPAKTSSVLAWIAGCFIKEHLRTRDVKFPHLMLIGEAGSGKSTTVERVVLPVFSRTKIIAAGQVTAFTLMKDSASSNLIPQALDEFKPSKIDKIRIDTLYNHFRNSYDGHEGVRGRADQSTVSYELLAPLIVAGEESADEAAIRERSIELLFSKKDLKSTEHRSSFQSLSASAPLLGSLGRSLLETALQTKPDEAHGWHQEGLLSFARELPSRVVNNLACCYAGLCLLEKMCCEFGFSWQEVFPYNREACRKYLEHAVKEYLLDGSTGNKSVVEQAFEVMSRMGLDPNSEFRITEDGKVLALWLAHVYDRYTKYRKDYAIVGETLSYAQFKRQLMHSDLFLGNNVPVRIGGDLRKVWTINFELLKSRCDVSGFEITEVEPL
ncbi:MAG: DNA-binding protein [Clostridiales bacterium]|nr:DNA-binding protein [Clostridiales bacterium]